MSTEVVNAFIERVSLGYEDHGMLRAFMYLRCGASGQGFGGYRLDAHDPLTQKSVPHASCGLFIARVLEVVGVDAWEKLTGKPVRALREGGAIRSLGNFIEEKWFTPSEEMK